MRAAVLWGLCMALASLGACKKKSSCVAQCERYAKCDPESVTDCSKACASMSAGTRDQLYRCDQAAKGECEPFLVCTGVKSKPVKPSPGVDAAITVGLPGADAGADGGADGAASR